MRAFTERPKSMIANTKRAFTSEDVPLKTTSSSVATTSMRRANTNESLVNLELAALGSSPSSTSSSPASSAPIMGSTPPQDHSEWAQKQLMDMVNRSADGQRVTGEDLVESFQTRGSAFSKHGKNRSALAPSPTPVSTSPLGHSQPISNPMDVPKQQQQQQRSLISSTSTSALLTAPTIRRAPVSNVLEARMKIKREKDLQMARSIMEEELKKARDREKLREVEHRLKAKAEEQQEEERLRAYYEHEKQHSQPTNTTTDDNFAYFKSMKKKIKDINVKPNLPSIGLDEKIKKFNTRVKGFLSTTNPAAGFSQKFRGEKKRDSKHVDRNLPIKLNIVDDFMKDLEYQKRMANDPTDTRGLSPIIEVRKKPISGPSELQQKRAARRKRFSQLEFSKSNGELQMLVRSISQGLEANNDAITNANHTCARIRAEMESTKTLLTRDVDSTNSKVSRTSQMGTQFATSVSEIRAQLDATRSATTSCSDQIKHLEVRVHKVQRAKKPADTVMRYLAWGLFALALIYLVARSRTCQVLAVLAFMTLMVRIIKDRRYSSSQASINMAGQGSPFQQHQVRKIEVDDKDDVTSSTESLPVHPSTSSSSSSSSSPKLTIHPAPATNLGSSFIRRNHSDLVLQSLLSEEEFAEVLNDSPKLKTLKEEDESMGISPSRSRKNDPNTTSTNNNNNNTNNSTTTNNNNYAYNNNNSNNEPQVESTGPKLRSSIRSGGPLRTSGGSIRTSTTNKDSVAMNLALHNLNQMSLKIQQMQSDHHHKES